jgi:hypothetical protein
MAKKKSDSAEVARRIDEVLRIRLDGAQFHDVLHYASENGWGVSERQLRTYLARADELLVERQDRSRKKVIARHLAQRQALFARAVNAADYRTALAILDSDAKLRGLFPDSREVKELLKLAAAQGGRIEELERRLKDALALAAPPPAVGEERAPAGRTPGEAAGRGGAAPPAPGGVPGGPAAADG